MWEGQEARGYGEVREVQVVWQSLKECGRGFWLKAAGS